MNAKCYFCDKELGTVVHNFRVGSRDEPVCEDCKVKTENRRRAKESGSN